MAVRKRVEQARITTGRNTARRNLITRTARVWTRLYKKLVPNLKEIAGKWLEGVIKQAVKESSSGAIGTLPAMPERFTKTIQNVLREAYAYGYWLNHLYVRDIEYTYNGGFKYRGRIRLADMPADEKIREILEQFMNFEDYEEWYDVIPREAVEWLDGYVPILAGNLSQQVLEKVQEVISTSLMSGSTLTERMKALREAGEEMQAMSNRRIESIARTEVTRADTLGRLSSMKSNEDVIGVEFSAVMDDRTTEICSSRHGLIMRLDDPRLPENTPPLHVNCVLGDTFILPIGRVSAYSKRVFNGNIFIIKTAGGNHLAGTPNHPILTSRGWIPLCKIKEGDYIVCNSFGERGDVVNGKNQQMVSRIEDAARAFLNNSKVRAAPVPMTAEDFHHDGGQSKVAIIYADGELLNRVESSVDKHVVKHDFILRNIASAFFESSKRTFFFFLNRMFSAFNGFMSFLSKFQAFFKCSILHSYKLLLMPITRFNTMLDKNTLNGIRGFDMESNSNAANTYTLTMQSDDSFMVNGIDGTFPLNAAFEQNIIHLIERGSVFFAKFTKIETRKIIFDKVVNIKRDRFNGHVYNLQTESGIFVASNIITHNCRSLLLSLTVYDYPDGVLTSHEFNEVSAGMQRVEDIAEAAKILGA